jgi:hypothetical protein
MGPTDGRTTVAVSRVNRRQDDVKIRSIGVEIASRRWRQRRYRRFLGA